MSEFTPVKREFYRKLACSNAATWRELTLDEVGPMTPEWTQRFERWHHRFLRLPELTERSKTPRLVNHFLLGADPEFVFLSAGGTPLPAQDFGLKAGLAYGADNNGRLVELRPSPSRCALDVLASMHVELRWLAQANPQLIDTQWKAGAFAGRDGLGGHIHFGRKQRSRELELNALDKAMSLLEALHMFDGREIARRRGDTRYGHFHDFRVQRHGYEYRTFPSWLDSPWMAFFMLVLAKLVVHDPTLMPTNNTPGVDLYSTRPRERVRNILSFYQNLDDDARLALLAWRRWGLPTRSLDFKGNWGIAPISPTSLLGQDVLPPYMPPRDEDKNELFEHLAFGKSLVPKQIPRTWAPLPIPEGLEAMQLYLDTHLHPGVGELCWDLATRLRHRITIHTMGEQVTSMGINVNEALLHQCNGDLVKELRACLPKVAARVDRAEDLGSVSLQISRAVLSTGFHFKALKKLFCSGILPIWQLGRCTVEDVKAWKAAPPPKPAKVSQPSVLIPIQ